jgi:copper chaperone NosL
MNRWWMADGRWGMANGKSPVFNYRLLITLFLFALVGCSSQTQSGVVKPPEIAYGYDLCEVHHTTIDDARFATATVMKDGQTRKFMGIGEMHIYHMNHLELQPVVWYVHDYHTKQWLDGEKAFYVQSKNIRSEMGQDVAAFAERAAAEAFGKTLNARVLTFNEVRVLVHETKHH